MEPVAYKLKLKYTANKRCKQNKSSSNRTGSAKNKSKKVKLIQNQRKIILYIDGRTGHRVFRDA